ncbi:acyl-CoA/acyl-ACP dehydrogenase [Streptomyces sp. NBC_01498]|uniref:acyl-CoA dehydrogenase family protein n=1 Tax=Streptomyces sp. NBC_01498 TaxID=2975870 RepID=UPI002E7AE9CE|nr:acyl-CoA dehydrogenase family protein [Streptomyces sp. NBC_01498]WTL23331.1 acyl-CoA/acyl-ACP dehydrogenase [Streptomyces sp. NBC_01498]
MSTLDETHETRPETFPADGAPDLLYSEAEDDLRAAVRSLLTDRGDATASLARAESGSPYDSALWTSLAGGIGAAGLLVPEALGGQGASHREAAVVLEELGRAVTPAPYLTSSVIATQTLLACDPDDGGGGGDGTAATALLGDLAEGRTVAVLAVPLATGPDAPLPGTAPGGVIRAVADAATADVLLVLGDDGLYAIAADAPGVTLRAQTPLDLTRPLSAVTVDPAAFAAGTRVAGPDRAVAAVRGGLLAGAGLLASEQLGLAEWCLAETVRHTRERHQFNRPLGSFQALKHRMAQLWLEVASARAAARNAADALATGSPDVRLAVAVAQAYCGRVAVHAAEECVQLHGGIGMTWEHPAHLYLKRAKSAEIALGSTGAHRTTLATLTDLPAPRTPQE